MRCHLLNVYMDGVVREVEKLRGNVYYVNQVLYVESSVIIGDSKENLQILLIEFDSACEWRKLKVNVGNIKIVVCGK